MLRKTLLILSCSLLLAGSLPLLSVPDASFSVARAGGIKTIPANVKRYALVIGNGNYAGSPLPNPVNDATAMGRSLKALDFDVTLATNIASDRDFRDVLDAFQAKLEAGSVALFFYAGHGVQVKGQNYLIPIEARIRKEADVANESLNVEDVIGALQERQTRMNILILDACRNNPYESKFRGGNGRGLAIVSDPIQGTLIAYATAANKTASDGSAGNGLYTQELLKALSNPGLNLEQVFKQVRLEVAEQSHNDQIPAEYSYVTEDFYFSPA
ncbi:MAG: caspase domain-containing protein, partial [Candidatus Sericytochromatia bacterium]